MESTQNYPFEYHRYFGKETTPRPLHSFPQLVVDRPVFIIQSDAWNCGCAQILHILDFYLFQTLCPYGPMVNYERAAGNKVVLKYDDFLFGKCGMINNDSKYVSTKLSSRRPLKTDFFSKLLSGFCRELIQVLDTVAVL